MNREVMRLIENTINESGRDPVSDMIENYRREVYEPHQRGGQYARIPKPDEVNAAVRLSEMISPSNELSEDELRLMDQHQASISRNQPVEATGGAGSFNPNNRFSLDTRGISSAVNRAGTAIANQQRGDRVADVLPEYQDLARRQGRAEEGRQGQMQILGNMIPQMAANQGQFARTMDRDEATHTRQEGVREDDRAHQVSLAELQQEHRIESENLRLENQKDLLDYQAAMEQDGVGERPYAQTYSGIANVVTSERNLLDNQESRLREMHDVYQGNEEEQERIDDRLNDIRSRKARLAELELKIYGSDQPRNPALLQEVMTELNSYYDVDSPATEGGPSEEAEGPTVSSSDLVDYAERYFGGNVDQARSLLERRGATFEE